MVDIYDKEAGLDGFLAVLLVCVGGVGLKLVVFQLVSLVFGLKRAVRIAPQLSYSVQRAARDTARSGGPSIAPVEQCRLPDIATVRNRFARMGTTFFSGSMRSKCGLPLKCRYLQPLQALPTL